MNDKVCSPKNLIYTNFSVPPVCIRPTVPCDSGTNEDDLSISLSNIVALNNQLKRTMNEGGQMTDFINQWDALQCEVTKFINGEVPGVKLKDNKPIKGIITRLKGKQGRFRGNLSGKRVEYSGRTVISPDPNLSVEEVGIPQEMAMQLTYPVKVTDFNRRYLQKLIRNGPDQYPGANYVKSIGERYIFLKYGDRNKIADNIKIGDIVERHLIDKDIVLFNRQPSLHRMSIMSHIARIMPWRTLRFNECDCSPYNADFDGDEMNIHVPQTEEARIEALVLMRIRHNFVSPRAGQPLIAACQDFLTAAYVLTQRDTFLTREDFCQICSYCGNANELIDIPTPAILKPFDLWTGKQVIDILLKPNRQCKTVINLELKAGNFIGYNQKHIIKDENGNVSSTTNYHNCMCSNDGYVIIKNSQLLCGNLCKKSLGGNKKGIVFILLRDHSPVEVSRFLGRLTRMTSRFLMNRGFSIGLDDVTPSNELNELKHSIINKNYSSASEKIKQYENGNLVLKPGCTAEQTLENECSGLLSDIRSTVGKELMHQLPKYNSPLIMATCGSKGSDINICQMMACVGQQIVNGNRIPEGFINRTLPHFRIHAKEPEAKGFVANSFYTGLNAMEFFFHTMGGREGLVDSAVKTADTGYMQRRLMKALEDLIAQYDNTGMNIYYYYNYLFFYSLILFLFFSLFSPLISISL